MVAQAPYPPVRYGDEPVYTTRISSDHASTAARKKLGWYCPTGSSLTIKLFFAKQSISCPYSQAVRYQDLLAFLCKQLYTWTSTIHGSCGA